MIKEVKDHTHKKCREEAIGLVVDIGYKLYKLQLFYHDKCQRSGVTEQANTLINQTQKSIDSIRHILNEQF